MRAIAWVSCPAECFEHPAGCIILEAPVGFEPTDRNLAGERRSTTSARGRKPLISFFPLPNWEVEGAGEDRLSRYSAGQEQYQDPAL